MFSAVAFLPHPPVLVPTVAQGAAPELDDLRAACRAAIQRVVDGRRPLLVGAGTRPQRHDPTARGSFRGYGVDLTVGLALGASGPVALPPSLAVGTWLLRDALGGAAEAAAVEIASGCDTLSSDGDDAVALLVMGDGSARRSERAPGHFDPRAEPYDASVAAALASGEPARLLRDGLEDANGLLVAGAEVWHAVGTALHGRQWRADLLYDRAPYGVGYFVATWT